jgi:hypothetical protein
LEKNKRRSQPSRSRCEQGVGSDSEEGLAIEAGLQRWFAIARNAGRNPQTRAQCFASDLALAEEIEAEERLLVEAAPGWSASRFFEKHTTGTPDYTKGSEHYVVRYRAGEKNRVLKATIPGKFGRYEYTPTIYLNSLRLLNEFVPALDILIHGIRVASDSRPSIVTSMQYIKGRHPHPKQIETYLFRLGWEHFDDRSETLDFRQKKSGQIIRDAHPRNWVYQASSDSMVPIDISIEEH